MEPTGNIYRWILEEFARIRLTDKKNSPEAKGKLAIYMESFIEMLVPGPTSGAS